MGIFAGKMWVAFANAKATHIFFSKNIGIYAIFNDQSFNDWLTNNMVSFEQLGPGCLQMLVHVSAHLHHTLIKLFFQVSFKCLHLANHSLENIYIWNLADEGIFFNSKRNHFWVQGGASNQNIVHLCKVLIYFFYVKNLLTQ